MLTKRIIACLDVKGGRVVKGTRFQNLRDLGQPSELAMRYEQEGADEIVFLDISATNEERELALKAVEATASALLIPLTVGGGIRDSEQARQALNSGADRISINTAAYENPPMISQLAKQFGSQCVVASVDAKRGPTSWNVVIRGGKQETAVNAVDWAKQCGDLGAGEVLLTSIDRDGTRSGYETDLISEVAEATFSSVIASGGAGRISDVIDAFAAKADAVLLAGILHDQIVNIGEIKKAMQQAGIATREV